MNEQIPDRFGELLAHQDATEQYMRAANCSWDRAARLFRVPPYHELSPDDEALELLSGENPQLERMLNYVRGGMPYREAERLVGPVE
jgi:hypothetical protein